MFRNISLKMSTYFFAIMLVVVGCLVELSLDQGATTQPAFVWAIRALLIVLVIASLWVMFRRVIPAMNMISQDMDHLSKGKVSDRHVDAPMTNEIGHMTKAFERLQAATVKKAKARKKEKESHEDMRLQLIEAQFLRERGEEMASEMVNIAEELSIARDEAEKATNRALEDQLRIRTILKTAHDAIITTDADGLIETFNPAAEQMFGQSEELVQGQSMMTLMPKSSRTKAAKYIKMLASENCHSSIGQMSIQKALRHDGTPFPIEMSISPMQIGDEIKLNGVIRDITDRIKAEEEIKRLAMTDSLTGLANRNQFDLRFDAALKMAKRQDCLAGLVMIDLDKFKPVNDQYGHPVGDALLKKVADELIKATRETDTVARLGGDEFAVVVTNIVDKQPMDVISDRIIQSLSQKMHILGHDVQIGASIGIALFPADGETTDSLLSNADKALYEAKNAGRGQFHYFAKG